MTNEEMYAKNKADREKRQRAQRSRTMVRRSASRVASAGGSMMETFVGSFDKVLSIILALILLFSMQKMMIETDDGLVAITPVMTALSLGDGVNYADVDAGNRIGYETGTDGSIGGRYFSLNGVTKGILFAESFGFGITTNPIIYGITAATGYITFLVGGALDPLGVGEWLEENATTEDALNMKSWIDFVDNPSWENFVGVWNGFWHNVGDAWNDLWG